MKKEIAIRKKRFAAFWTGLVLVCCLVMPITVKAADHTVAESLEGSTLVAGDTLRYSEASDKYNIQYRDYDGSTLLFTETSGDDNTHIVLEYPSLQEGLNFEGWRVENVYVSSGKLESVTLQALVSPKAYAITYQLDGGTNGNNPTSYTYGTGVPSFEDATKQGYLFEGWYSEAEFNTKVESIGSAQTGDITLYAKFVFDPGAIGTGTFELKAGEAYKLGSGVQRVSGDSSVYGSEITFYVPQDGSYTFQ